MIEKPAEMEYRATITKEEIQLFNPCIYEGDVIIVDNPDMVDEALSQFNDCKFIGFDTETRPSFKKGDIHPVSLLQLGTRDSVVLFRLNKTGLTSSLKKFLSNPSIIKVGVGIRDDQKSLQRLSPFIPASFIDLQDLAPKYGIEEKSFSKLMAIIFGVKISKRQRVTNWEAEPLTESQIRYAATDAWGAYIMYEQLLS